MKIIEHNQDRLKVSFRDSFWFGLLFGIAFIIGGLFFSTLGLALRQFEGNLPPIGWISSLGGGILLTVSGLIWMVKLTQTSTFTFDKRKNCIIWERHDIRNAVIQSVDFPLHLITGITIDSDADSVGYYTKLILAPLFWRIPLNSNGDYQSAQILVKMLTEFLKITYFPDESKAPVRRLTTQDLGSSELKQEGWKYLENEIERLSQHLGQHPEDAEAHQDLGISLYLLYPFLNRKKAINYLQHAENLFETQLELDRAAVARVLQALVR
jgi:ribosomal protein S15P/S13E